MFQEQINHTSTQSMVDYIDEDTPIKTTQDDTTQDDITRIVYTDIDTASLYPDFDVKIRKGKYIFEMTKAENDKVSVNLCIETALKKIAFLAFQNASKTKTKYEKPSLT